MSERDPSLTQPESNMAALVGVGGLLSVKTQWAYYAPMLGGSASPLSAKERFLPIPDKGLSPFDEMYGQLEEQLAKTYERLEERVVLFGHSLGGLMVTELALDNPDKISSVICLAGAQDGIKKLTPTGKILKRFLGNPEHSADLFHDSDMMTEHRERIATEWPSHISLHLISPTYDDLIPAPQGLGLELPEGQQPQRRIIVPRLPGVEFGIRARTKDVPNVRWLRPILPAGHVDIAICPPVIAYTRKVRRAAVESLETATVLQPAAAVTMPAAVAA